MEANTAFDGAAIIDGDDPTAKVNSLENNYDDTLQVQIDHYAHTIFFEWYS
jgi:hypothetical protein